MRNRTNKLLIPSLWLTLALFTLCCIIFKPMTLYDHINYIAKVVSITLIIMGIYEKILWRYNPFEKIPKLYGKYEGMLKYCYKGVSEEKKIEIVIKQSLLNVSVKILTNEINSYSLFANLIHENEEYILYYTYITNPKSEFSKENPMQYGSCRLIINIDHVIRGTYWTSQGSTGDIYFLNKKKEHA